MIDNSGNNKPVVYYIDNRKLYDELCIHKEACRAATERGVETPRVTSYVGECIMLLSKNIGNMACFSGYSYLEEMIGDGVENCMMYGISNFDPTRCYPDKVPTPYSYFTQIITWAFIRRIQKEKKQHYIKLKNCRKQILVEQLHDNRYTPPVEEVNNDQFIKKFEEDIAKKKQKRAPIKGKGVLALDYHRKDK
jgi:hypothetical protein